MQAKIKNEYGTISTYTHVISKIAAFVVSRCYGVVGTVPLGKAGEFFSALGADDSFSAIKSVINDGCVSIKLAIVVRYGVNITATARSIKNDIKYQVESMTGLYVSEVSVNVQDIAL